MQEPTLTQEGQETLDAILLSRNTPIINPRWKTKIYHNLSLTMAARGVTEAGKDLVLEAVRFVTEGSFAPIIDNMKDAEKFKQDRSWESDNETYYTTPRRVKRWESMATKPAKPPGEMKVLAFNASPRQGGNNDALIDEALRGAREAGAKVEKLMLYKLNIKSCIHCRKCKEPGYEKYCSLKDDMSDFVFEKILGADVIIVGFPIYTGDEPAKLTLFIERLFCVRRFDGKQLFKPGERTAMVIGTWGTWNENVDTYDDVVQKIITILKVRRIKTVEAISACGFAGMFRGLDDDRKAIISRFPEELKKVHLAGRALVVGK